MINSFTVIWSAPKSEGAGAAPPTLEPVKPTFFLSLIEKLG